MLHFGGALEFQVEGSGSGRLLRKEDALVKEIAELRKAIQKR